MTTPPRRAQPVATIAAPVFDHHGRVAMIVAVHPLQALTRKRIDWIGRRKDQVTTNLYRSISDGPTTRDELESGRCSLDTPAPSTPRTGIRIDRCSPTMRTSTTRRPAPSPAAANRSPIGWPGVRRDSDVDALHHQHRSQIDGDTAQVRAMFYNPMHLPGMTELVIAAATTTTIGPHRRRLAQPQPAGRQRLVHWVLGRAARLVIRAKYSLY